MKFLTPLALFSVSILASSIASANTNSLSEYYSKMNAANHSINKTVHPVTDITVINATNNSIYVIVPNSPINDYLVPERNDHIYNSAGYDTHLVLNDIYGRTFFSTMVCRLAIVTAYGYPGNMRINVDSDLCY